MPVTATPIFPQAFRTQHAQISTANTNRDGSGTLVTIFTAGSNGSKIDHIDITATVATTAGMVRLYLSDGTNHRLWREIAVSAITPSGTTSVFRATVDCSDKSNSLYLANGNSIRASTHNAETFNVAIAGADY